ncbi:MAG: MlaE family ABC transporter permease [Bacteroidota bacterium]
MDVNKTEYYFDSKMKIFFIEFGKVLNFLGITIKQYFTKPYEWKEFYYQSFVIGNKTFIIIGVTSFILGLVLSVQLIPVLNDFGAIAWMPKIISLSIIKEIGPVITGLICAGKVGSSIGAELGSMRVTEQIDAMDVSGTNPMKYLVSTRVLAATLMLPVLVIYADALSLFGAYIAMNMNENVSFFLFFSNAFEALSFTDIVPAIIKTFAFGMAIGVIACYKGYYAEKGTSGVGKAANSAVVVASLAIFIIDMLAVQINQLIINL